MSSDTPATPLAKKLGITDDTVFTVRNAPPGFAATLGDIGGAVWQQSMLAPLDMVVTFHTRRAALELEWPKLVGPLTPDGAVWIAVPRPSSGAQADLDEGRIRYFADKAGWDDTKACSIDEHWTALRFVRRPVTLRPRDTAKRKR